MPDYIDQLERNNTYLDIHDTGLRNSLGTASTKDSTNVVVSNSTDLVESGAVKDAIDNAITSAYKASGSKSCSELVSSLLIADNEGNVYNITDSGETTSDFIEGSGHPINAGNDVAVIEVSENTYKFNIMGGFIDLSNYVEKEEGKGLSANDYTTAEKNKLEGISTNANKVESSTTNGNIKIDSVETPVYRNYGNNAVLTTDKTPFLTRQTLNPTGFSGYVREKLVGASYAWNQLCANGNFATTGDGWTTTRGSLSISNNIGTFTSGAGSDNNLRNVLTDYYIAGHKYLISFKYKSNVEFVFQPPAKPNVVQCDITSNWTTVILIVTNSTYAASLNTAYWYNYDSLTAGAWVLQLMEYQAIDLTLAFGSTIADYLYSLTNNGGITKLRDMGCPIDKYTAYGYNLVSSKTSGKKIVGKNLLGFSNVDFTISNVNFKSQNNTVIANGTASTNISSTASDYKNNFKFTLSAGTYYFSINTSGVPTVRMTSDDTVIVQGNGTFTLSQKTELYLGIYIPGNTVFSLRDLKINLTIGSTTTTYEPYSSTTYPLGNDELRGKFDLVNGEIVASGDVKDSNGEITRSWKEIDLGSLDYQRSNNAGNWDNYLFYVQISDMANYAEKRCAIYTMSDEGIVHVSNKCITRASNNYLYIRDDSYTDTSTFKTAMNGVKMIYPLATPATEQSTPFADPMSMVGATTEEYIDTRDIPCPVGAERQYMGQSEDVVEIPSSPLSDGKRVLISEVSGGKEQVYWDIPTLYYKEYTVQGDGTKTYGDLLAELKPYYEALSEDEKTYSKVMMRATSSGNECLTFVGNYWYSRMGVNSSGLWLDQIDFQYNKYFKQASGGSIEDYTNTNAGTNVLALRVLTYTRAES